MKRPGKQVAVPTTAPDDAEPYGPAMAALKTDRQRAFVTAFVLEPKGSQADAARKAGYGGPKMSALSYAQIATRLMRDDKILAAIAEESRKLLKAGAPRAVKALLNLIDDPSHKGHERAVAAVVDRLDPPQSQHHLVVEHRADEAQMIEATIRLARELGVPVAQLLGHNRDLSAFGVVIEGEAVEVPAEAPVERKPDYSALGFREPQEEE